MSISKFLAAAFAAALLSCHGAAFAQSAQEKAQNGIAGYMAIMAIAQTCKFTMDKPTTELVVGNINLLQPKAKMSDAELDAVLKGVSDGLVKRKDSPCAMGQAKFNLVISEMAKNAVAEANGSGVALKPVPAMAAAPAQPPADGGKAAAANLLMVAHMLEAVSDECKIELTSKESLDLDRAQYYFRGKADYSAAQVKELVATVEAEVQKSKAKVCAPDWGFKSTYKSIVDMIK